MQHAGGDPLPPSHEPRQGGAGNGWPPPRSGHPAPPPPPAQPPGPTAPPPPTQPPGPTAPPPPAQPPGPVAPGPVLPGTAPPPPPVAPDWPAPAPYGGSGGPAADGTGRIPLPPGGPVPVPGYAPGAAAPDPSHATIAVLLIGPAGAGKTTVARHWSESRRVPTAHISLDDVREWVRSGFADPQSGWNEHSEAQYRLARRTCGFAARNFLANGISCIIDDAVFPDRAVVGLGGWKRHVGPGLLPVVLLPGLEVVLERNAERAGNRRLADEEVALIHGKMAGWYGSGLPIIDNSQLDVVTTARLLDDVLTRSLTSPPTW